MFIATIVPITGPFQNNPILAIIALPIALVVFGSVGMVICVASIVLKKSKPSGTYRPQQAEREYGVQLNATTQSTGIEQVPRVQRDINSDVTEEERVHANII